MSTDWADVDYLAASNRQRDLRESISDARSHMALSEVELADLEAQCERAEGVTWIASLYEPRTVEIDATQHQMLQTSVERYEACEASMETVARSAVSVDALDLVVEAAAYVVAETIGTKGPHKGRWYLPVSDEELAGSPRRFSASCGGAHEVELSCPPGRIDRGDDGSVIADAVLVTHRQSAQPWRLSVATGRVEIGGRTVRWVEGPTVTEACDEWLAPSLPRVEAPGPSLGL